MISSRAVGAGAFVVIGLLLFAVGLFMIGERRMLFEKRFPVYTEFKRLGELEVGATVRVAGATAGEVTDIQLPTSPSGTFRVKMQLREALHPIVRTDSVAATQTEGLIGGVYLNIAAGTEKAPLLPEGGTIRGREPFAIADLLQQASDTIASVNQTVTELRGDVEFAVKQVAMTAEDARQMVQEIRPEIEEMARNGSRISRDTSEMVTRINEGKGTFGKLINDDGLYDRARGIADQAQMVMANMRQVTEEARHAIVDFRSKDGPTQGLLTDMRMTLGQAREATADLADNMEAMKHNFLLRGFFNKRGYYDLESISPAEYRTGVLENGKRKAMRIWLKSSVLFRTDPDGTEALTDDGRARIDSAMATYLKYLPSNPIVIEGYAPAPSVAERFRLSRRRAALVRAYVLSRYEVPPQNAGFIGLGEEAPGSPENDRWDGVSLTLFLDRELLQFINTATR
jgi:phospholipid/cholesterol/gamma-HCH transport system substrate-binding protein